MILPETIKRSLDVLKTLEFLTSIFQHHSDLFFSNDVNKKYFIFLRDVLIKISQCDFIGPRFLATSFGNFIAFMNYIFPVKMFCNVLFRFKNNNWFVKI